MSKLREISGGLKFPPPAPFFELLIDPESSKLGKRQDRKQQCELRDTSMINRTETLNILREATVTVFVNSVAGGGRARFFLTRIQKLFESFHVHAQFVMTKSALE